MKMDCPFCFKKIPADAKVCPLCGDGLLDLPSHQKVHVTDEIDCPYCAEKIKRKAVKCRHCGTNLTSEQPVAQPAISTIRLRNEVRCPVCQSSSPPAEAKKGSALVLFVLLLLWILPGVIYWIFCSGYAYVCPECGYKYGDMIVCRPPIPLKEKLKKLWLFSLGMSIVINLLCIWGISSSWYDPSKRAELIPALIWLGFLLVFFFFRL